MLTVTPEASQAIQAILASDGAPEGAVFRISAQDPSGPDADTNLAVSVIDDPPPSDQVVDGDGVQVNLGPEAAEMLDDKELDATVADGQAHFSLSAQRS